MISTLRLGTQKYSHDMYVRLKVDDLASIDFIHLYSESIRKIYQSYPHGITEWTGIHDEQTLSIAWDWIVLNDGIFTMPKKAVIRTNLMLVDGRGYDTDPTTTDSACAIKIATLGWQKVLQRMLQNNELS